MKDSAPTHTLTELRQSLSPRQKTILNRIVVTFMEQGKGIPLRLLHHEFGTSFTKQHVSTLTGIVFETTDSEAGNRYEPTAVGLLLSNRGEHYEQLLVRYLEYLEFLFRHHPMQTTVTYQEVQQHLRLSDQDRTFLGPLIRTTSLYDSSTGYSPDGKWTAGVLKDSEQLPEWPSKKDFLHQWVLRRYHPDMPVYQADRERYVFGSPLIDAPKHVKPRRSASTRKKDFFISYNKADTKVAERIQAWLEEAGYSTFMQAADFHGGSNFVLKMDEGMKTTHRTLAILSRNYLGSRFTPVEWADAFSRDPKGEIGILVPVRIDDTDVDGILGITSHIRIEHFVSAGDWENAKRTLLEKIAALPSFKKGETNKPSRTRAQNRPDPAPPKSPQSVAQTTTPFDRFDELELRVIMVFGTDDPEPLAPERIWEIA
ncbi:MAG TPA: toll/interleukin-1 receptor domain-containing protein, partial [Candidatus Binatia bacterium]|nr:toll/interleukin-1 receptor domain-containing protein [Candidatus Binatia bacterium]